MNAGSIPPHTFESHKKYKKRATHGYDPKLTQDLDAIFIASGPAFKKGLKIKSFENIHIFPFLAKILNVSNDHAIDGKLSVLLPVLK